MVERINYAVDSIVLRYYAGHKKELASDLPTGAGFVCRQQLYLPSIATRSEVASGAASREWDRVVQSATWHYRPAEHVQITAYPLRLELDALDPLVYFNLVVLIV